MGKPIPVGNPTDIGIKERPQLIRTTSVGNDLSPNSAYMSLKARKFRDIMLSGKAVDIWDKGIGWLLCVCLQNIPFLRKTLLTSNVNTFSYKVSENNSVQLYKKTEKMIVSMLLGGAGYRGITNFVANGLNNESIALENFAPRSHDFDISFGVKNYHRDIDHIKNTIVQILIVFLNMMFNELEIEEFDYWTGIHNDSEDKEIFFIPVNDAPHDKSREKVLWTHDSGLIQISVLKTVKYTNIRTNVAIQYINEKGKSIKELDHIIELVFWDMEAKEGTVDILNEIKSDNNIINVLAYLSDTKLDTQNYRTKTEKKYPMFTGNDQNYYNEPSEDFYPDDDTAIDDNNELNLYNVNGSPYNNYFNEAPNMIFCPILRLDKLGTATFSGLTGRSSGKSMAKCRQDYSRLFFAIVSANMWPEFKKTQGDIDTVDKDLSTLTIPADWNAMTTEQQADFTKEKVDSKNYSDTNYVQCRTFDEANSDLKKLADSKFECYSSETCLNKQGEEEQLKIKNKQGKNYGYGYEDEPENFYNETPLKDNIPIEKLSVNDITLLNTDEFGNPYLDEFGNDIITDGCLVDLINGKIYYDPNLYVSKSELKRLAEILNEKFKTSSGGKKTKKHSTEKHKRHTKRKNKY